MFHVTCMDLGRFPCMLHACCMHLTCTVHVHVTCILHACNVQLLKYVAMATGIGAGIGYYIGYICTYNVFTYMHAACIQHASISTKEYMCIEALTNLLYYIRFKHCINNHLLDLQFSLWVYYGTCM